MAKDEKETKEETSKGPAQQKMRTVESAPAAPVAKPEPEKEVEKEKPAPAPKEEKVMTMTAVTDGPEHVSPELTDIAKEKEAKRKDRVLSGKLFVNGKDPR